MHLAEEKRRYPRAKIRCQVIVETPGQLFDGETLDIGVGGAFIECQEMLGPNESFTMAIMNVPFLNRPVLVSAGVVWTNSHGPDLVVSPRGMGVQFTKISDMDRGFISNLVSGYFS